jgi:3',5'-nucleoside bisphosphate phosphatase
MLREYRADLHIHTCLSPCASLDLSPRKIVERAREERLEIIAITDHNSARNVRVVAELGELMGLKVLAGMEVQTREEIHLLTLFPEWGSIVPWEEEVSRHLPDVKNDPEVFGDQPVVDGEGNILGFEDRLLINSLDLSLEEVKRKVEERGGLVIPSHFNKGAFSLISQLGMLPPHLRLEALEMTRRTESGNSGLPVSPSPSVPQILSSDSHFPEDIGGAYTVYLLAEPTLKELRLALRGQEGRRIVQRVDRGVTVL